MLAACPKHTLSFSSFIICSGQQWAWVKALDSMTAFHQGVTVWHSSGPRDVGKILWERQPFLKKKQNKVMLGDSSLPFYLLPAYSADMRPGVRWEWLCRDGRGCSRLWSAQDSPPGTACCLSCSRDLSIQAHHYYIFCYLQQNRILILFQARLRDMKSKA